MIPCHTFLSYGLFSSNDDLENIILFLLYMITFCVLEDFDAFKILRVKQYLLIFHEKYRVLFHFLQFPSPFFSQNCTNNTIALETRAPFHI